MSSAEELAEKFESGEAEFKESTSGKRTKSEQAEHKHPHPEGDTRRTLTNRLNNQEKSKEQNLKEQDPARHPEGDTRRTKTDSVLEYVHNEVEKSVMNAMKWLVFLGRGFTISLKIATILLTTVDKVCVQAHRAISVLFALPIVFLEVLMHLTRKANIDVRKMYYSRNDIDNGCLKLEHLPMSTDVGIETTALSISKNMLYKRFGYRHKKQPTEPNSDSLIDKQLPATTVGSSAMLDVSDSTQQLSAVDRTQKLCSAKMNISDLANAYNVDTSAEYYIKALDIGQRYSHIRYIRGDGNCFYRAMVTGVLELCVTNRNECERITKVCKEWMPKLGNFGFPELTTSDFCEAFDTMLDSIADGTKTMDFLFDDLNNDSVANYYVAFSRLIASGFLRENAPDYVGFIDGCRSMDQYCQDEIDPMWKECDHLGIIALVNAFQTPIRIEYMDRTQAPDGDWCHDMHVGDAPISIFLLYRPGHYDILYRR